MLDFYDENPVSRIPNTNYKSLEGIKSDIAQHLNLHITIPYKTKRPTLYCPTATSESKKKVPSATAAKSSSKESDTTLKKIKETKKESSSYAATAAAGSRTAPTPAANNKRKSAAPPREKSADAAGEPQHRALTRGNALLKSQKLEPKKEELVVRRKEHKLNNAFLPPIEKIPEPPTKKLKQNVRHIKVKIGAVKAGEKKLGKSAAKASKKTTDPVKKAKPKRSNTKTG